MKGEEDLGEDKPDPFQTSSESGKRDVQPRKK